MTKYRWLCQPVQPSVPTAPPTPAHPSYIIDSALPPVSGDDYATVQVENADLRRQLDAAQAWGELQAAIVAAVPRDAIDDLYTAYAYATAGSEVHALFPAVGRWLGKLAEVQP